MSQPITRITPQMMAVMGALADDVRRPGPRIAEAASVRASSLYSLLPRLERAGLVTSSWGQDPDSTRVVQRKYYRLTSQGKAALGG